MSSNNQSLIPTTTFRIRLQDKEMDVVGHFCPNPKCTCEDATLYFYEANGGFDVKLFKLNLNYKAWQLVSTQIYRDDEDYAKLIHEFMNELNDDIKSMILTGKENAISNRCVLRDDIDYSELKMDIMVPYPDIYQVAPYEQWVFDFDATRCFVLDYYCPNPNCDCMDVLLSFLIVKDSEACDEPVLEYWVKLKTGEGVCEKKDSHFSAQYAEELFAKFLEFLDLRGNSLFEERYLRIKKWGKDYLQSKIFSPNTLPAGSKVGRNSPCPCGSGLKYKKCCGK